MTRWSLGNRLLPLSHKQFVSLTEQFRAACAQSWGQPCTLAIKVLNRPEAYTTFYDEDAFARLKEQNNAHILLESPHIADVSETLFNAAKHLTVSVRPVNPDAAPAHAFGNVEFKGHFTRRATFYVQPDGADIRAAVTRENNGMVRRDGFESHGDNDGGTMIMMAARHGVPGEAISRMLGRLSR